jgi:hypothetical protein
MQVERLASLYRLASLTEHTGRDRDVFSAGGRRQLGFLLAQKDLRRCPTYRTLASHSGLPVFHGDLLAILHLGLLLALDTICFHVCSTLFLWLERRFAEKGEPELRLLSLLLV